jgi:hypothetical protein
MINANKYRLMRENFCPLCISGTFHILLSTYFSWRNNPIAANRREIMLTAVMSNDPPVLVAEIADIDAWINDAVSDPKIDAMRV